MTETPTSSPPAPPVEPTPCATPPTPPTGDVDDPVALEEVPDVDAAQPPDSWGTDGQGGDE